MQYIRANTLPKSSNEMMASLTPLTQQVISRPTMNGTHQQQAMQHAKGRVLDIGCAVGRHALYLQEQGHDVLGIDVSPLAIKTCKLRGLKNVRIIPITQASQNKLGTFDTLLKQNPETLWENEASYLYLPIWRKKQSPSGADQTWHALHFGSENLGQRQTLPFRMADGHKGQKLTGRLRFRIYNLHEKDIIHIDLNNVEIPKNAILERKKTNIHVAADTRYPGMHIPPHIAYEIDLAKCPPLRGDNELGLTLILRTPNINSDCMIEALEIDVSWNGHPQTVGYTIPDNDQENAT